MHRVELKEDAAGVRFCKVKEFLMHRVELKVVEKWAMEKGVEVRS